VAAVDAAGKVVVDVEEHALQSVTMLSRASTSSGTAPRPTQPWIFSSSATADLTHTLQWPSRPPLKRSVASLPAVRM
jgi:hypothetical protein